MNNIIHISINGIEREVAANTSLADLVKTVQLEAGQADDPQALATAVNEIFIPRGQRADTPLCEADKIFTFSPITGG